MAKSQQSDSVRSLILKLCDERGWNRTQLADAAGISATTVYSLFDATRSHYRIRRDTLRAIATALDVDEHVLLLADSPAPRLSALLDAWCRLDESGQATIVEAAQSMRASVP